VSGRISLVICWAQISGYMAACWRELARQSEIDLYVLAFDSRRAGANAAFADDVMAGVPCRLLSAEEADNSRLIASLVCERKPAVLAIAGWFHQPYRALLREPDLANTRFIMGMDTPLRLGLGQIVKQHINRIRIGSFVRRMDRVFVAGERAWQYAGFLGAAESRLRRGFYGIDYDAFSPLHARRSAQHGGWPKRFLFTGRYESIKGIDVLLDGHARYRELARKADPSSEPWGLTCCGQGPCRDLIAARAGQGVDDLGFVQPGAMPELMSRHGVFVLASRFDPWPLVIVEACAAGFPILCTEACGSSVELVRSHYNGRVVASGDVDALANAMFWMHQNHSRLPEMGARSQPMAAAYSAQVWAQRWTSVVTELVFPSTKN
jgi:glycosyltransferase involved in cell wall biosynthesis